MEGSLVRGHFGMNDHAALKMGAKIYGGTTIGPHCKVGGEVSNSVFKPILTRDMMGLLATRLLENGAI